MSEKEMLYEQKLQFADRMAEWFMTDTADLMERVMQGDEDASALTARNRLNCYLEYKNNASAGKAEMEEYLKNGGWKADKIARFFEKCEEDAEHSSVESGYANFAWRKDYALYAFSDYDDFGENIPCSGADFRLLLKTCAQYGKYVSFILESDELERFPFLKENLVSRDEHHRLTSIYNRQLRYSLDSEVYFFNVTDALLAALSEISDDLWGFVHAWKLDNPEDLTFYREDGSVFFTSVAHEGEAEFTLREGESIEDFITGAQRVSCVKEDLSESAY